MAILRAGGVAINAERPTVAEQSSRGAWEDEPSSHQSPEVAGNRIIEGYHVRLNDSNTRSGYGSNFLPGEEGIRSVICSTIVF